MTFIPSRWFVLLGVLLWPSVAVALDCTVDGTTYPCDIEPPACGASCTVPGFSHSSCDGNGDGFCVICGDGAANTILGTFGSDVLCGFGGEDVIVGIDGEDIVSGGDGDDLLYAGDGDALMYGGDGDDLLTAFDGDDALFGELGDDELRGGRGDDLLYGGGGRDVLLGQAGDDYLTTTDAAGACPTAGLFGAILCGGPDGDTLDACGPGRMCLDGGRGIDRCEYESPPPPSTGYEVLRECEGPDATAFGGLARCGCGGRE